VKDKEKINRYQQNAGEVGAGIVTYGALVINRTRKQVGSGLEDLFHAGDPGYVTKEDVAAMHYHARQRGHNDEDLRWRVHSRYVLGINALCWGAETLSPLLVQRIVNHKGWADNHLVGIDLVFDDELPVDEMHLEKVHEGGPVTPVGMIKTTFELFQEGPE
jgi:hypothetical protein